MLRISGTADEPMIRRLASGRGAGDETRTRDIFLGKEVLYQLSYTRALTI
jgi:hypothetical protein